MRIITGGRTHGTTERLIDAACKAFDDGKNVLIVCRSKAEASRIFHSARATGRQMIFPLTFDEFLHHRYNGKVVHAFLIDTADELLQSLANAPIDTITLTTYDEVNEEAKPPSGTQDGQ